jgi:cytochrome d ubiquinol oxidase subunit II
VLCGVATVFGYALLGACWLVWRTDGPQQGRSRRYAGILGIVTLLFIGAVSLWTPFLNPVFTARWFTWPGVALTSPVPVLMALLAIGFWVGLARRHHVTPFLCALGWFVLCFAIWDAAAPAASQAFLLVGAAVLIPIILTYTIIAYIVFRGKVTTEVHYH